MNVILHYFLWNLRLAKAWTWYTDEECAALEKYASGKKRLAEIGCWQGVNTARLRKSMSSKGILFAVDPYAKGRLGFNAAEKIAQHQVDRICNGSVRWMKMTDLEAAATLKKENQEPLDLIFSDSLNTYEGFQNTWNAWKGLLADGGIYVLANSHPSAQKPIENAGSVRFTRDVILKDPSFQFLDAPGCFTVLQKVRHGH